MLVEIIKVDMKCHAYLPVVVGFARHCAEDLAGILPRKQRTLLTKYDIRPPQFQVCLCYIMCVVFKHIFFYSYFLKINKKSLRHFYMIILTL